MMKYSESDNYGADASLACKAMDGDQTEASK